jgi:hypothetical protein
LSLIAIRRWTVRCRLERRVKAKGFVPFVLDGRGAALYSAQRFGAKAR